MKHQGGRDSNLAQQLYIALLPSLALTLQKRDLGIPGLEFSVRHTRLFFRRLKFGRQGFQLGVQLARTLRVRFAVGTQRHVALTENVELVDPLQHLGVLCVRRGCFDSALAFLCNAFQ